MRFASFCQPDCQAAGQPTAAVAPDEAAITVANTNAAAPATIVALTLIPARVARRGGTRGFPTNLLLHRLLERQRPGSARARSRGTERRASSYHVPRKPKWRNWQT